MANAFTKVYDFYVGSTSKSDIVVEGTLVIDTAAGAAVGSIPASLFGLTVITRPVAIIDSANTISRMGVPSYDGTSLLVKNVATSGFTDLANATYSLAVQGRSSN